MKLTFSLEINNELCTLFFKSLFFSLLLILFIIFYEYIFDYLAFLLQKFIDLFSCNDNFFVPILGKTININLQKK